MQHIDRDVQSAITRLNDALCSWERATGIESVLIIRGIGFCHRSVSGKPVSDGMNDLTDHELIHNIFGYQVAPADG